MAAAGMDNNSAGGMNCVDNAVVGSSGGNSGNGGSSSAGGGGGGAAVTGGTTNLSSMNINSNGSTVATNSASAISEMGKRKKLKSRNSTTLPASILNSSIGSGGGGYSKDHLDAWLETCLKDASTTQLSSSSEFLDYNPTVKTSTSNSANNLNQKNLLSQQQQQSPIFNMANLGQQQQQQQQTQRLGAYQQQLQHQQQQQSGIAPPALSHQSQYYAPPQQVQVPQRLPSRQFQSPPQPVSLHRDILVNYRQPLPPINPDSEYISHPQVVRNPIAANPYYRNGGNQYRPAGIPVPNLNIESEADVYFLTPKFRRANNLGNTNNSENRNQPATNGK
uniref:Suppressor of forked protein (Suf) n=1 Tax=Musca domestica TaxID=7370 RepID=T1P975_MUSDO